MVASVSSTYGKNSRKYSPGKAPVISGSKVIDSSRLILSPIESSEDDVFNIIPDDSGDE